MHRPRVRRGEGRVYRLRVELDGITPPIWRRLEVSGRASLDELQGVIEAAFMPAGEAYEFEVDGVTYVDANGDPAAGHSTDEVALEALHLHVGARFTHAIEGASVPWRFVIAVEDISPRLVGQKLPVCTGGARAAPGEFIESVDEYMNLLTLVDERRLASGPVLEQWDAPEFDPDFFDAVAINAALARVPRHRPDS